MNNPLTGLFKDYRSLPGRYDEMFLENGRPQPVFRKLLELLDKNTLEDFKHYRHLADNIFRNNGTTFLVYKHEMGTEEIFAFDLIPLLLNDILENTDAVCETLAAEFFEPQRNIGAIEETMGGGQQ